MGATEDAAARRVIAGQRPQGIPWRGTRLPKFAASRELFAPRADVWKVIAEPHRFRDWWPGIGGIQPDRRGFAPGARWRIVGDDRPRFLRRPNAGGILQVLAIVPPERFR